MTLLHGNGRALTKYDLTDWKKSFCTTIPDVVLG
jgi:hypothetical protein